MFPLVRDISPDFFPKIDFKFLASTGLFSEASILRLALKLQPIHAEPSYEAKPMAIKERIINGNRIYEVIVSTEFLKRTGGNDPVE